MLVEIANVRRPRPSWLASSVLCAALIFAAACHGEDSSRSIDDGGLADAESSSEGDDDARAAENGDAAASERAALCARPADDAVRDIFCHSDKPSVTSLRELLSRLAIDALPADMDEEAAAALPFDKNMVSDGVALLGHSTALSGQLVSSINPRAILFNHDTLIAFQRGAQKVEIATQDRSGERRNFYLVTFKQACNDAPAGCVPGDLFTLAIERDWLSVQLRDDEDLKNTPFDCRQCHQRKLEKPTLLMRELLGPWPHFFIFDSIPYKEGEGPTGREILLDYLTAKGSESYAGLFSGRLRQTTGAVLQRMVGRPQPLLFDPAIPTQVNDPERADNPQRSGIWDTAFAAFKRGEQLALPYFAQRASDPQKLSSLSDAYARYRRGELAREALPDLADIFPDDPQVRAEIGLQTEPNATPAETLIQACGACHNDVLDQTISRARFNIALARMSHDEIALAVSRIERDPHDELVMPPKGMRQLDPGGRERLLDYLRNGERNSEDDALLDAAARAGMAVRGGYTY